MSIRALEDQLFEEWRATRPDLVADGVVDESTYTRSSPKLLFILKEVNDRGGGGWDLRQFVREGGRAQTWNNVTRWVEGIRRLPQEIAWQELAEIDEARRRSALQSIAVVNLKKSPGIHTTDESLLSMIAYEDRSLLHRQLSLYDPDLTICCGTSNTFNQLGDSVAQLNWQTTRRGIRFREDTPRKFVVEYLHPLARCAPALLYYGLVDALRDILEPARP